VVATNNPTAKVIERAKNNKIRTDFSKEELNESKVLQKLKSIGPDLIVLAGFY
jgi:phosphoribosylglycinamide formyltransferase-1